MLQVDVTLASGRCNCYFRLSDPQARKNRKTISEEEGSRDKGDKGMRRNTRGGGTKCAGMHIAGIKADLWKTKDRYRVRNKERVAGTAVVGIVVVGGAAVAGAGMVGAAAVSACAIFALVYQGKAEQHPSHRLFCPRHLYSNRLTALDNGLFNRLATLEELYVTRIDCISHFRASN